MIKHVHGTYHDLSLEYWGIQYPLCGKDTFIPKYIRIIHMINSE